MKPQDLIFLIILIGLVIVRKPKLLVVGGLICLAASIPLFEFWIFFTAQRLTYYAATFLLIAVILYFLQKAEK